jgi:hypothetical protein
MRVGGDRPQVLGRDRAARAEQLHERDAELGAQHLQVLALEGLHEHLRAGVVEPVAAQRVDQCGLERQAD